MNIKVFNLMSVINEARHIEWYESCNVNLEQMQVFIITSNVWIIINSDVNVKNWLTKEDVTKNSIGILVNMNVTVIKHVT